MSSSPAYNILMYSHDTYGLGHIRRTMAIASHLKDENTNILILTGSVFKLHPDNTFDLLELIATKSTITQILFLIGPKELPLASSALKAGSYQYAKLPVPDEELRMLVDAALSSRSQYGLNLLLKKGIVLHSKFQLLSLA